MERKQSDATKLKRAETMRKKWADPEFRKKRDEAINNPETKEKMRQAKLGRKLSDEHKKKIGAASSRIQNDPDYKEKKSIKSKEMWSNPEFKEKHSKIMKEVTSNPEYKEKISIASKKMWEDPEYREKVSNINKINNDKPERRKFVSEQFKKLWDDPEYHQDMILKRPRGEDHPNWRGGASYGDYCKEWKPSRSRCRSFFNYTCVECGKLESENITENGKQWNLSVHHVFGNKDMCCEQDEIDYTKRKMVPLCINCHCKITNSKDQEYWQNKFSKLIDEQYGGKCYYTKEEMLDIKLKQYNENKNDKL